MGSDFSKSKVNLLPATKNPRLVSVLSSQNQLFYPRLCQIYQNVTRLTGENNASSDTTTNSTLLKSQRDGATSCPYLDEALFEQCFSLKPAVSGGLFKAFDREEDGVVEWKSVLAGLTVCGDASVQQKCQLISSIFDLSPRASIFTEELHNVISISLLATGRICQTILKLTTNEIHINPAAAAHEILDEVTPNMAPNKDGSFVMTDLASHLESSGSLYRTLCGLGLYIDPKDPVTALSMANSHTLKSTQLSRSSLLSASNNSLNGSSYTLVWANVFPNHPIMPCTRSKHAACCHDNQIYVYGGRNGNATLKDLWKYDLVSNIWTQMLCGGDTPPPLQEHTMVACNNKLYLFGGEFGFRDADDIPLWIFNTTHKSWQQQEIKSEVKTPCSRRGHTAVIANGAMHVYGGYIDLKGSVSDFWLLDFESSWWHLNPDDPCSERPVARHLHTAVVYDGAMWVYGGLNNLIALKDLWKWDFSTRQWSRVKFWSGPPALYGHSATVSHDAMLVFGGQDADGVIRSTLWKYHFGSQSWQKVIYQQGLTPPPNTRHILLSAISTIQLHSPIIEDLRPRSAPHPSKQRKVTPLLQAIEHMQELEIRPHSSPPCVTPSDAVSTKMQRKPFKNRIHLASRVADGANFASGEEDYQAGDETPLISTAKETSAISSAMSPMRLFDRSKWASSALENGSIFDKRAVPVAADDDTEVFCNPMAPDILIVEDISDVSSLLSFVDEETSQFGIKGCQPYVTLKCNDLSLSNMPPVSINPTTNLNVRSRNDSSTENALTHHSGQLQSAMTSSVCNDFDINFNKNSSTSAPSKDLNHKQGFNKLANSPGRRQVSKVEAERTPSMHVLQESLPEQSVSATNHLVDQSLRMQDNEGHHKNNEIQRNMQSRVRTTGNQPDEEPLKQQESCPHHSHRVVQCKPLQDTNRDVDEDGDLMQDGASRPKMHGRSKTMQSLPLDRQAGGAVTLNHRDKLSRSAHAGKLKDNMSNTSSTGSMCLVLLGGQERLTSNLQYITNPLSMWKCHIVPGKPTKKEIQELLSQ